MVGSRTNFAKLVLKLRIGAENRTLDIFFDKNKKMIFSIIYTDYFFCYNTLKKNINYRNENYV